MENPVTNTKKVSVTEKVIIPPPPSKINIGRANSELDGLPSFNLDISELNRILEKGYLKKKKAERHSSIVHKLVLRISSSDNKIHLISLTLMMKFDPSKRSPHHKKVEKMEWSRTFIINTKRQKSKGTSAIEIDTDEIYNSIFRDLSRNTHIKDEERKISINFRISYYSEHESTGGDSQRTLIHRILNIQSTPFFICGWRKAMKLEKKLKIVKAKMDWEERLLTQSKVAGINPVVGTCVQPVSVYVKTSDENMRELLVFVSGEGHELQDILRVCFGTMEATVLCSCAIEKVHTVYRGCLRIVCLTPLTNFQGSLDVTIRILMSRNSSRKKNGGKEIESLNVIPGSASFCFVHANPAHVLPPLPPSFPNQFQGEDEGNLSLARNNPLPQQQQTPQQQESNTNQTFLNHFLGEDTSLAHTKKKRKLNDGGTEKKNV